MKDALEEFKTEVAAFTGNKFVRYFLRIVIPKSNRSSSFSIFIGISDNSQLEQTTLIILNLYLREKTSANRKEELQRIFTISDFRNITKISNVSASILFVDISLYLKLISFSFVQGVNEILKLFSTNQLEDFKVKWSEVFQDRIEEIERSFCSIAKLKDNECSKCEKLSNSKWMNAVRSNSLKKSRLLNQIVSIERLADENRGFHAKISERKLSPVGVDNCPNNLSQDSHSDEKIIEIDISLFNNGSIDPLNYKTNQSSLYRKENGTKLICKVGSSFLFREFNRKEAEKILVSQLKGWVRQESLLEPREIVRNKVPNTETQSCRDFNYFGKHFDDNELKAANNVVREYRLLINYNLIFLV